MKAHTKSARLTLCITFFILIAVAAAAATLPWLTDWYIRKTGRKEELRTVIMTVCYICLPAALAALYSLIRLLKNILDGEIFIQGNVLHLRLLSWYCGAVSLITLAAGYFYLPFYLRRCILRQLCTEWNIHLLVFINIQCFVSVAGTYHMPYTFKSPADKTIINTNEKQITYKAL